VVFGRGESKTGKAAFGQRYSALAKPFAWTFTRQELERRLRDPLLDLDPLLALQKAA
jgi:hypothetical protein